MFFCLTVEGRLVVS